MRLDTAPEEGEGWPDRRPSGVLRGYFVNVTVKLCVAVVAPERVAVTVAV